MSGIDASVLVRLMHYAEVPVPTSEIQGAFSISIRNVEGYAGDRDLLDSRVCFGRIGALNSYPLQIKCKELGGLLSFPAERSAVGTLLREKFSGFNFQSVTCINEDQFG